MPPRAARGRPPAPVPPPPTRPRRVLVMSHGHPAITRGGAEIAAYALFEELNRTPGYEAWFLGCNPEPGAGHLGVSIAQPFGEREYVYAAGPFDWFKFSNQDEAFTAAFTELLRDVAPDIIHLHHFMFFGLDSIWLAKTVLPAVRVVLTAHEYLLICHAYGQMVTADKQFLCYGASLDKCHACFPDIPRSDFFLRRHWAELFLPYLDAVVAPSAFLAGRLAAWGLGAVRLHVIENLIRPPAPGSATPAPPGAGLRVGFFGQISRLKGIGVLLDAAALLAAEAGPPIAIEIHGTYTSQPPEFQAEFLEQLGRAPPLVRYHGPYVPHQVDALMRTVSTVVVPSIWWENSPVVIQEAFRNRRPVICSDIGGMAEKVRHGTDGWQFPVGSAPSLAALLRSLAEEPGQIAAMAATVCLPPEPDAILHAHAQMYEEIYNPTTRAGL